MEFALFLLFSFVCLVAALNMLVQKQTVYCALSLVVCLGSLACLYWLLNAPFAAAMQIIIYAGAVMVLFLFVIMLLDPRSDLASGQPGRKLFSALLLGITLFTLLGMLIGRSAKHIETALSRSSLTANSIDADQVGQALFSRFQLPLVAVGILILMATLGAVLLAKKKI